MSILADIGSAINLVKQAKDLADQLKNLELKAVIVDLQGKLDSFWQPKTLDCKVDVLAEIAACCTSDYDLKKVAYLKELGRAAFANPIDPDPFYELLEPPFRRHAEKLVADYKEHGGEVHRCPVCGIEAALVS